MTPATITTGRPHRRLAGLAALACLATGLAVVDGLPASAEGFTTRFVNVNNAGQRSNGFSRFPSVSLTARIIAFDSTGSDLVSGDTNGLSDVFIRFAGVPSTVRASVSSTGAQANGVSVRPSLDFFASRVAFQSTASNLVGDDTNGVEDVFVRNLRSPASTARVSVSSTGAQANGSSGSPAIEKGEGRFVAFVSLASNLVPGDTNGVGDVFVRDMVAGTTTRVSVSSTGAQGNGLSFEPSTNGQYVTFASDASNLVPGDTNGVSDVFVRDMVAGTTTRVSVSSTGVQANAASRGASISDSGSYIGFSSEASNLVAGDTNQVSDVFVYKVNGGDAGTTVRASVSSTGAEGNKASFAPSMGTTFIGFAIVAFVSDATNLVDGDTNGIPDVFRRDLSPRGLTDRWSVATDGSQASAGTGSGQPAMMHNGQAIAFVSNAANLAPGDNLLSQDVFVRLP